MVVVVRMDMIVMVMMVVMMMVVNRLGGAGFAVGHRFGGLSTATAVTHDGSPNRFNRRSGTAPSTRAPA